MDGYAVRFADVQSGTTLAVQGESLAGHPYTLPLEEGCAVRIFTGAALPANADTIVIQENTAAGVSAEGTGLVTINQMPASGDYVRPIGHDIGQDQQLLQAGTRLRAFDIASATTSGLRELPVTPKLRVGVFATGDELRTPGQSLAPGQIYESNRIAIRSLLAELPVTITDLGILPDDPDATREALRSASLEQDALITSGGVSVGDADFVRSAIEEVGAIDFWRLNLRPGKPFAFGHINRSTESGATDSDAAPCLVFGLPGNPVSTIVTLLLLVKPALWHLAGASAMQPAQLKAPLAQSVHHSIGRNEYQRGALVEVNGETRVATTSDQSSNRLQSFKAADCLFLMPGETESLEAGDLVTVLPFWGLL